jgi:L-threonylcarbamoyladenylate synthase
MELESPPMTTFVLLSPEPGSRLLPAATATAVADALRQGGLAVLPTETGHLLAAAATVPAAVRAAFAVKRRDLANPMHLACSGLPMAAEYAELDPVARCLLDAYTPGPLSVVVAKSSRLPDGLVTLNGTVGIRIPEPPATRQVIEALGQPVTATSLNRSGEESRPVDRALLDSLDWPVGATVHAVVENDAVTCLAASTLVRLTGPGVEVLRSGPVDAASIAATVAGCARAPAVRARG